MLPTACHPGSIGADNVKAFWTTTDPPGNHNPWFQDSNIAILPLPVLTFTGRRTLGELRPSIRNAQNRCRPARLCHPADGLPLGESRKLFIFEKKNQKTFTC
jgi:hypothetical protein